LMMLLIWISLQKSLIKLDICSKTDLAILKSKGFLNRYRDEIIDASI